MIHKNDMINNIDFTRVRDDFPIFKEFENLIYLDNAATSQKPQAVINAISDFYLHKNSNVHRSFYRLAEDATGEYERTRELVRDFIHARSTREIIYTRGTTESINLVAQTWGADNLVAGDTILLSEMEHHSNLVPWQILAKKHNYTLKFIEFDKFGRIRTHALDEIWDDTIKFVSITHSSNVFGTYNDIEYIIDYAHRKGAKVMIDAAQSVPHIPVDVRELDCDFLAFSGHKMCGPTGIGVLYGKEALLEDAVPYQGGGDMINSVRLEESTWNELPYKFEAGTPNIAGAIGLGAAIEYLNSIGMDNVEKRTLELTKLAICEITEIKGVTIYGNPSNGNGTISFNIEGIHPHDLCQITGTMGVALRGGHHCAQPIMRKLGLSATARASIYFYNNEHDIALLKEALIKTKEFFTL